MRVPAFDRAHPPETLETGEIAIVGRQDGPMLQGLGCNVRVGGQGSPNLPLCSRSLRISPC